MKSNSSNLRAIRLCYSFSPSYFPLMILNAILSVLGPYYNLYLSAEIVNEITGSKNIKIIVVLVIITVLGNFLISILGGLITRCLSHSAKKNGAGGITLLYAEDSFHELCRFRNS